MTALPWRTLAASLFLVLGTAACGGDTTTGTTDSGTTDSGTTDSGSTGTAVAYADVQAIWDATCAGTGCHTEGGTSGALSLSAGESHANLVDVPAVGAAMDLVTGGSTDDSYLWHKLAGTQFDVGGSGSDMPIGLSLSSDQVATIQDWILGGALAD